MSLPFKSHRTTLSLLLLVGAITPALAQPAAIHLGAAPNQDVLTLPPDSIDAALADLPDHISAVMARSGAPGVAVAVVHGGETIYAQGFGVRERGKDALIDADTVFQIASVSKPLAATVAAIQVAAGIVDWDDLAQQYLPDLALGDPAVSAMTTIGDLYAHRTGLPMAAGDDLEDFGFSRDDIVARLRHLPLDAFRTSYHYANFGITTGAEAVAAASGLPWEDLAEQALYQPLGMTATSSRYADFLARDNRAALHVLQDGTFQPLYQRDADAQSPAGGVSSSVNDLAKWLQLLLAMGEHDGGALFTPQAMLPALSPQAFSGRPHAVDARPGFYGYGFNVGVNTSGRTAFNHSGAFTLGAGTHIQFIPSADIAIVVLTNGGPIGLAEGIAFQFMDIVQYGSPTRDWFAAFNGVMAHYYDPVGDLAGQKPPADPAPAQALADYAGSYANDYFGPILITADADGLQLSIGPRGDSFRLQHWQGDVFAMTPSSENAPKDSRSSVIFDRAAGTVHIDYLDANGLATWTR
ncbi:beta-lactamase [Devosia limi DSM 17137]|uniref:Beta-lactamase n=1 Tax=Devosia limi DSM 17137 TaxID=1121477 RepID=A0A0F5LWC0_9HYPH|nr:serine hydrolase [Devosia limi]KKB86494.1 beta-lactamase [Devosia limi DSM 17137]SHE86681.1 CubicO group peptidase, beta-lactamase class C family [Devosia limi DSM 17137]